MVYNEEKNCLYQNNVNTNKYYYQIATIDTWSWNNLETKKDQ